LGEHLGSTNPNVDPTRPVFAQTLCIKKVMTRIDLPSAPELAASN
jgi:hypothetical protein